LAARKLPFATARMPKRVVIFIGIVLATGVASVTALLRIARTRSRSRHSLSGDAIPREVFQKRRTLQRAATNAEPAVSIDSGTFDGGAHFGPARDEVMF
jgi:hypothetical protein